MSLDKTLEGRRVRLVYTNDQYTLLKPGALGTVKYETYDDLWLEEKLAVEWDNGSSLRLIAGDDHWEILPLEEVK